METLGTSEESISVAMEEVKPRDWVRRVYDADIATSLDRLYKKPGYDPADLLDLSTYAMIPSAEGVEAATRPLGVSMANLKAIAKGTGCDHALALELWATGIYEARMLATLVDEPGRVTLAQMDAWCRDFDNWGIVDTACFALFDWTPNAWAKVAKWSKRKAEFEKCAAFCFGGSRVHDKAAPDAKFIESLTLIEKAAADERHFVKKAVNMALRATGKRNAKLKAASVAIALRLAASEDPSVRWVGKDALRESSWRRRGALWHTFPAARFLPTRR